MLTLGAAREVVGQYTELFGDILKKSLVKDLTIEISGILPSLVGVLGAVADEVQRKSYTHLTTRLGNATTFNWGKSPY